MLFLEGFAHAERPAIVGGRVMAASPDKEKAAF